MPVRYPFILCPGLFRLRLLRHCLFRLHLFVLACALSSSSCMKLLQTPPPNIRLQGTVIFSTDSGAESSLSGLYSLMMTHQRLLCDGGVSLYGGLSGNELHINGTAGNAEEGGFAYDTLSSGNLLCSALYGPSYSYIGAANQILQELSSSPGLSADVVQRLRGEAEFTRALVYFYMVNLFGAIPLATGADYLVNGTMARTSADTVYAKIIADLQDAQTLLPEVYSGRVLNPGDRTHPNKWAAAALLARVYLYRQQWSDAETQAGAVIGNTPLYRLETDPDSVFLTVSREAIWQLQSVSGLNTAEGNIFLPRPGPAAAPVYLLDNGLLQLFEPGDLRLADWVASRSTGSGVTTYPFKYKISSGGPPYSEYNTVLRLGEQYLIRAEARARQGNIAGAAADLNAIRARAGLGAVTWTDTDSVLAAVMRERQKELFSEWGHRWLDLKRTGQTDAVLGPVKPGWKTSDALYPIPFSELQLNPALTQNPGY